MQTNKKIMLLLIPALLTFLLPGCQIPKEPVKIVFQSDPAGRQQGGSVSKRFQEPVSKGPTAVESAIELSQKYAMLSEETSGLRQENQDFINENSRFKDQIAALEAQLQQTQKELTEANDLLIEMRIELNNWKTDILGFRHEMRGAEKAQLEALLKILGILGGEVKTESAKELSQPQLQETPTSGESNE